MSWRRVAAVAPLVDRKSADTWKFVAPWGRAAPGAGCRVISPRSGLIRSADLRTKSVESGVTAWPDDVVDAFAEGVEGILVIPRPVADDVQAAVAMGRVSQYRASISARTVKRRVMTGLSTLAVDCDDLVHHRSPEVPAGTKRLCVVLDY